MKALQKASKFLSDYTSVVVIAIAVVTFFLPSMMGWVNLALFTDMVANKFTCQSIIIGIIMFSMGLTLTTEDFKILAQRPFDICVGAIAQYLIMPFLAFAISKSIKSARRNRTSLTDSRRMLSWRRIFKYHVISVRRRCSILRRNDNRIHIAPPVMTRCWYLSWQWHTDYDQRSSNVRIYHRNGNPSCRCRILIKLSSRKETDIPRTSTGNAWNRSAWSCMCSRRRCILTGSQILPVRCCNLYCCTASQWIRISVGIRSRKTGWNEHIKEENHLHRSWYAECRSGNKPRNNNRTVCIHTGIRNHLRCILHMALHLRNLTCRNVCNA